MALLRFAIDVIYLDREGHCLKVVRDLRPYRFSAGGRRARAALELPSGTTERLDVKQGDTLVLETTTGDPVRL